jgi:hypothetical protein
MKNKIYNFFNHPAVEFILIVAISIAFILWATTFK